MIDIEIEEKLYAYLARVCTTSKCYPIKIGGYSNHVHILAQLSKTISISELVEILKTRSSIWMKKENAQLKNFYWQNGYEVFGVDRNGLVSLSRYIANQRHHHHKVSFEQEYKSLLVENEMAFEERYVWD